MDSLQDLLGKHSPKEPAEVLAIKRYIHETYNTVTSVGLRGETIVITVTSASLANTLRYQVPNLQAVAQTNKKILFRIG
jgi:hypothetical protein